MHDVKPAARRFSFVFELADHFYGQPRRFPVILAENFPFGTI